MDLVVSHQSSPFLSIHFPRFGWYSQSRFVRLFKQIARFGRCSPKAAHVVVEVRDQNNNPRRNPGHVFEAPLAAGPSCNHRCQRPHRRHPDFGGPAGGQHRQPNRPVSTRSPSPARRRHPRLRRRRRDRLLRLFLLADAFGASDPSPLHSWHMLRQIVFYLCPPAVPAYQDSSNPWLVKLQGAAVLGNRAHDVLRRPLRDLGIYLQDDPYLCPDEAGEMGDHLVGDLAGVPAHPCGVERNRAMKTAASSSQVAAVALAQSRPYQVVPPPDPREPAPAWAAPPRRAAGGPPSA